MAEYPDMNAERRSDQYGLNDTCADHLGAGSFLCSIGRALRRLRPQALHPEMEWARSSLPPCQSYRCGNLPAATKAMRAANAEVVEFRELVSRRCVVTWSLS